jgi:hypothetical protein
MLDLIHFYHSQRDGYAKSERRMTHYEHKDGFLSVKRKTLNERCLMLDSGFW